jgi:hypothetical protein
MSLDERDRPSSCELCILLCTASSDHGARPPSGESIEALLADFPSIGIGVGGGQPNDEACAGEDQREC